MRYRSENQITLVFIRHGVTKSNETHDYLGKTDEPLSENGKLKLLENKRQNAYPDVEFLFTSPMKRCIQTAEILYPGNVPIRINEWEEMDFGAFEGKNYKQLQGDARYEAWLESGGTLPFPGGEGREAFVLRCKKGFQKMAAKITGRRDFDTVRSIGIVVHGGTIMALLSSYGTGNYFDYQVANGDGFVCTVKDFDTKPEMIKVVSIL